MNVQRTKNLDLALHAYPDMFFEHVGLQLDPWHREFLGQRARNNLLLCGRQIGKSTTTSGVCVHEAEYYAPILILLTSPSERQSKEILRKVNEIYHLFMGEDNQILERESTLQLETKRGSRIVALPGNEATVRGFSKVGLLVIDEASRVPDQFYYTARPMLATSGGRMIALTTPFGKRGWFYDQWTKDNDFLKIKYTSEQCARIPPEFLRQEREDIPDFWYQQEYLCEFLDPVDSLFTHEQIQAAMSYDVAPLFEGEII
ncbi:MAG: terminase family protein [Planctomycetota bacterium]